MNKPMMTEVTTGFLVSRITHSHQDAVDYNAGRVLGEVAFARGVFVAALDAEAAEFLAGRQPGQSVYFLKGWNVGNTQARLAA